MRTKIHNWYDPVNHRPLFGIMVFVKGMWMNASRDGKPMLFEHEADRDKARAILRKQPAPDSLTRVFNN